METHLDVCEYNPNRNFGHVMANNCQVNSFENLDPPPNCPDTQSSNWLLDFEPWPLDESLPQPPPAQRSDFDQLNHSLVSSQAKQDTLEIEAIIEFKLKKLEQQFDEKFNSIQASFEHRFNIENQKQLRSFESESQKTIASFKKQFELSLKKLEIKINKEINSSKVKSSKAECQKVKPDELKNQFNVLLENERKHLDQELIKIRKDLDLISKKKISSIQANQEKEIDKLKCEFQKSIFEIKKTNQTVKRLIDKEMMEFRKAFKKQSKDDMNCEKLDKKIKDAVTEQLSELEMVDKKLEKHETKIKRMLDLNIKKLNVSLESKERKLKALVNKLSSNYSNQAKHVQNVTNNGLATRDHLVQTEINENVQNGEVSMSLSKTASVKRRPGRPKRNRKWHFKRRFKEDKQSAFTDENQSKPLHEHIQSNNEKTKISSDEASSDTLILTSDQESEKFKAEKLSSDKSENQAVQQTEIKIEEKNEEKIEDKKKEENEKKSEDNSENKSEDQNINKCEDKIEDSLSNQLKTNISNEPNQDSNTFVNKNEANNNVTKKPDQSPTKEVNNKSKEENTDILAKIVNEVLFKDTGISEPWEQVTTPKPPFLQPFVNSRSDLHPRASDTILVAITRPLAPPRLALATTTPKANINPGLDTHAIIRPNLSLQSQIVTLLPSSANNKVGSNKEVQTSSQLSEEKQTTTTTTTTTLNETTATDVYKTLPSKEENKPLKPFTASEENNLNLVLTKEANRSTDESKNSPDQSEKINNQENEACEIKSNENKLNAGLKEIDLEHPQNYLIKGKKIKKRKCKRKRKFSGFRRIEISKPAESQSKTDLPNCEAMQKSDTQNFEKSINRCQEEEEEEGNKVEDRLRSSKRLKLTTSEQDSSLEDKPLGVKRKRGLKKVRQKIGSKEKRKGLRNRELVSLINEMGPNLNLNKRVLRKRANQNEKIKSKSFSKKSKSTLKQVQKQSLPKDLNDPKAKKSKLKEHSVIQHNEKDQDFALVEEHGVNNEDKMLNNQEKEKINKVDQSAGQRKVMPKKKSIKNRKRKTNPNVNLSKSSLLKKFKTDQVNDDQLSSSNQFTSFVPNESQIDLTADQVIKIEVELLLLSILNKVETSLSKMSGNTIDEHGTSYSYSKSDHENNCNNMISLIQDDLSESASKNKTNQINHQIDTKDEILFSQKDVKSDSFSQMIATKTSEEASSCMKKLKYADMLTKESTLEFNCPENENTDLEKESVLSKVMSPDVTLLKLEVR